MEVCLLWKLFVVRDFCDGLIPRQEESSRVYVICSAIFGNNNPLHLKRVDGRKYYIFITNFDALIIIYS